jgi:hypothetical protein
MLSGAGAHAWRPWQRQPPPSAPAGARLRGSLAVSAMFGFNWPWAGSKDGEKKEGKFDSILKAARTARRGCPLAPKEAPPGLKLATFAGGCFWGLELAYQRVPGVVSTSVGYTGARAMLAGFLGGGGGAACWLGRQSLVGVPPVYGGGG